MERLRRGPRAVSTTLPLAPTEGDEALAPTNASGGTDLRDTQDEWEVEPGEVVEMATATMDGGCTFELSVG